MSKPDVRKGLKPGDHLSLNGINNLLPDAQKRLLVKMRRSYENDKLALEQIDHYDGRSKVNGKLSEYAKALKLGDQQRISDLEDWFRQNYPLTEDKDI